MKDLNDDQFQWVRRLAAIRAQKKALEAQEKDAIAQIRVLAAGEGTLAHGGKPVAFDREVPQTRIDVKLLREERPDVAEAYTVTTTTRRLTLADGVA